MTYPPAPSIRVLMVQISIINMKNILSTFARNNLIIRVLMVQLNMYVSIINFHHFCTDCFFFIELPSVNDFLRSVKILGQVCVKTYVISALIHLTSNYYYLRKILLIFILIFIIFYFYILTRI